jgi:hypothetical protein
VIGIAKFHYCVAGVAHLPSYDGIVVETEEWNSLAKHDYALAWLLSVSPL